MENGLSILLIAVLAIPLFASGRKERLRIVEEAGLSGEGPAEGTEAPDFELARLPASKGTDAPTDETVRLSSFEGKKPVALVFGSYT